MNNSKKCSYSTWSSEVCGNVKIGKNTFIGAGANILPNTIVPENSVVGAGKISLNNMIKGKKY